MKCVNCAAELQPPYRFCGVCGTAQPEPREEGPFHYSGPGGQGEQTVDAIVGFIVADPEADHFLWKEGFDGWKSWRDLPVVAEAADKALAIAAESPEKVAEYEAMFQQFMSDGVLEDWEKQELADVRAHLGISEHTHQRLLKQHQERRTAALRVQVDQASMRSFRAQQFCVIRLRVANAGRKGLRTVKVQAVTSSTEGLVVVDSPGLGPGRDEVVTLRLKPNVAGQHELRALFTAITYTGKQTHYRTRAVVFNVARPHGQGGAQVYNMDLSSMQVGKIGNLGAEQPSGAGLGGAADWIDLFTSPISDLEAQDWLRQHGGAAAAPPPAPERPSAPVAPPSAPPAPAQRKPTFFHYSGPDGQAPAPIEAAEVVKKVQANPSGDHHVWAEGFAGWKPWNEVAELVSLHAEQAGSGASEGWSGMAGHVAKRLLREAAREAVAFTLRSDIHALDLLSRNAWTVLDGVDAHALLAAGAVKGWTRRGDRVLACVDGPSLLATNQHDLLLRAIASDDPRPEARLLRALASRAPTARRLLEGLPPSASALRLLGTAHLDGADAARPGVREAARTTDSAEDLFELVRLTRHLLGDETRALRLVESVVHDTRIQQRVGLTDDLALSAWVAQARAQLLGDVDEARSAIERVSSSALATASPAAALAHVAARGLLLDDARGLVRMLTRLQVSLSSNRQASLGAGLAHAWVLLASDENGARESLSLEPGEASSWSAIAGAWVHLLGDERKAMALVAGWEARASSATELVALCRIHRTIFAQPDEARRTLGAAREHARSNTDWASLAEEAHVQGDDATFFRTMLGWRESAGRPGQGIGPLLVVAQAWSELAGDIDEVATVLEAAAELARSGQAGGNRAEQLRELAQAYETLADDPAAAARLQVEAERPAPAASPPAAPAPAFSAPSTSPGGFPTAVTLDVAHAVDVSTVQGLAATRSGGFVACGTTTSRTVLLSLADLDPMKDHDRHSDWVRGMAMSDDSRLIASGCDDGKVVLWDLDDDEQIESKVHSDYVRDIRFEHGKTGWEQRFVTVGDDGLVSMRQHREELWRFKFDDGTRAVDFTPDNRHIWVGKAEFGNNLVCMDARNGARLETLDGHNDWINAVRISPDGRWLASGSDDHTIRIWDLQQKTLKHTLKGHDDEVNAVAWHPDSRMLAATADDGRLTVWDTQTGQKLAFIQEGGGSDGENVVFVNNGSEILWADDVGGLRRYRWSASSTGATGSPGRTHKPSSRASSARGLSLSVKKTRALSSVRSIAVSPDGAHIAVGTTDKQVLRCNPQTLATASSHKKHTDWVRGLAISTCGTYVASGCDDGHVVFWDGSDDEQLFKEKVHTDYVRAAVIIPNGAGYQQKYATGGDDNRVVMHKRNEVVWDQDLGNQVHSLAWTPDQTTLFAGLGDSDDNIVCLNASDGRERHRLPGHDDWVRALAVSPGGDRLASGSDTGDVKIWDIQGRNTTPLHVLKEHSEHVKGLAWHPSEPWLASVAEDGRVNIWNTQTGERMGSKVFAGACHAVAFSSDGSELYIGGKPGEPDPLGGEQPPANFHRIALAPTNTPYKEPVASSSGLLETLTKRNTNKGLSVSVPPNGSFFALSKHNQQVERCKQSDASYDKRHEKHTDWVRALSMSDDGRLIASGCDDGHIVVMDTNDDETLLLKSAHSDYVRSIAFEHKATGYKQRFVSGGDDNRVVMRRRREVIWEVDVGHQARAVAFSATNRFIWVGLGNFGDNLVVLNAENGRKLNTNLTGHDDWINAIAISPNGRLVATAADDNQIKIWTPSDQKLTQTLKGHTDDVNDVAWHPDNRTLAAAGEDGRITVWDTQTGALLAKRDFGGDAQAVAFIEGGRVLLAVGDPMGVLRLKWK